jgi:hypothetical protein
MLGSSLAGVFTEIQSTSNPAQLVSSLAGYALILWVLVIFWQVSRRSPFVFSEEDAYLLCQTPVNRRKVALAWYLQGVLGTIIPLASGLVILSFALVEWRLQGEVRIFLLFEYLKASLRALILILPLQIGWQAALWGLGALRLHQRNEFAWGRPVFLGAVAFFLAGFLLPGLHLLLLAPLNLPLKVAFMEDVPILDWLGGLSLSFLYLAAGLEFLSFQSKNINLSRTAQETSHIAAFGLARSYGQLDLIGTISLRRRLGTTRPASRLLYRPDGNVLYWKDLLQSLRAFQLRDFANLVWVFGLSLGMSRPSNWAFQMVAAGVWTISVGGLTTRRLRSDLARWWLFRSLPVRRAGRGPDPRR